MDNRRVESSQIVLCVKSSGRTKRKSIYPYSRILTKNYPLLQLTSNNQNLKRRRVGAMKSVPEHQRSWCRKACSKLGMTIPNHKGHQIKNLQDQTVEISTTVETTSIFANIISKYSKLFPFLTFSFKICTDLAIGELMAQMASVVLTSLCF